MRDRFAAALPWLLALGALGVLGQVAETALAAHSLQWAQDLAFFHQIFWNAANGLPWTSPLLLEPTGFFSMVHFHPLIALLLPFYMLRPEVSTLLWFNVLAVTMATVPLAMLAWERTGSRLIAASAAVAWLAWLPAQMAALADFRPMVFLVPGFLVILWGHQAGRRLVLVLGAVLCFSAREEASYLVTGLGLGLLLGPLARGRRGDGLLLVGLGAGWFVFLLIFKENFFFHFDPRTWFSSVAGTGGPPPELTRARLEHLLLLFAGGFAPALLAPGLLLALAPPLAWLLTDPHREWQAFIGTYPYFRHVLIPLLAAGGVVGWAQVASWVGAHGRRERLVMVATLMVLGNALAFYGERSRLEQHRQGLASAAGSVEVRELDRLLGEVPDDARVATDYRLVAALSGRRVLWNVAHMYLDDPPPPWWEVEWPLTLARVDTLVVPLDDPVLQRLEPGAWTRAEQAAGYGLWRRTEPPPGGHPDPLPRR